MLHHHPSINPQIHSIPAPIYPPAPHIHSSHIHSSPHVHSSPHAHLPSDAHPSSHAPPQTISVSYLPSATSLYITLLQPLSIQILHSFPQQHTQTPSSVFGHAQIYPPRPLLILVQSSPHISSDLARVVLQASSQQALHNFWAQCETLLPGTVGPVEPTENGEGCAVRDLDGNLIEVHWSAHPSEAGGRYVNQNSPYSRSSYSKRDRERRPEAVQQRVRDKQWETDGENMRERFRERSKITDTDIDRNYERVENLVSPRERGSERKKNDDRGQDRRRMKREKESPIPDVMPISSLKSSDKKNRRVLQWQKNVAESTHTRRDEAHSEDYEDSEQSEYSGKSDDYEDSEDAWQSEEPWQLHKSDESYESAYSDDRRPRTSHPKNYPYKGISLMNRREKGKLLESNDDTFSRSEGYQALVRGTKQVLKSRERPNGFRKELERNPNGYYEEPSSHTKRLQERNSLGTRSKYISNSRDSGVAADAVVCGNYDSSPESSLLRATLRRNTLRSSSPKNSSARCNQDNRRRKQESDRAFLGQIGRRDSGIAGIGGLSSGEKERAYLHHNSSKRDLKAINRTRKETVMSFHGRVPESTRLHNRRSFHTQSKGNYRINNSDSGVRYPSSANSSFSASNDESFHSYTSEPEPYYRPETSHTVAGRRIENMKRMTLEDGRQGHPSENLRSRHRERHRGEISRHDSKIGPKYQSRSRSSDYQSYSHPSHTVSVLSQCPSSYSGSTMRAEGEMLAKVPTPPSAISPGSRLRGGRVMVDNRGYDNYRDNPKNSRTEYQKNKSATLPERSYHKSARYNSPQDYPHRSSRRNDMRSAYLSRSVEESSLHPRSTSYGYAPSVASSESASSINKERVRNRRSKGQRQKLR